MKYSQKEIDKFRRTYNLGVVCFVKNNKRPAKWLRHSVARVAFWDGWYDAKHKRAMDRIGESWEMKTQYYWREG